MMGGLTLRSRVARGAPSNDATLSRRLRAARLFGDASGAAAVEFALVLPVLLLALAGIIQCGIALNNYLEVTDAAREGARTFAISRTVSTPYTTTTSAVKASAANLTSGSITTTLLVNGTACTSDTGCTTALTAAPGGAATVTVSYPCLGSAGSAYVFYRTFISTSGCTLTSTATDLIE